MNIALPPQLKSLATEIRGNPRLQVGLTLIVLLFLGWVFLVLGDARRTQLQQLEQGRQRLVQVKQLAGQKVWLERADAAKRLADTLDAEIPPAKSPGLAQAAFQGWLKEIVDSQGTNLRIDVQSPAYVEDPADVVRVTAVVSGGLEPQRVWQMIHRIEGHAALVSIPTLTVRSDGANKAFSLTVQGYYRLPAPPPESLQ